MEQVENLALLEEAIDKLLKSLQEVRQEKLQLLARLEKQEKEATELRQQVEDIQGERSRIHQRVAGLIETIDKWEKASGGQEQSGAARSKSGDGQTLF